MSRKQVWRLNRNVLNVGLRYRSEVTRRGHRYSSIRRNDTQGDLYLQESEERKVQGKGMGVHRSAYHPEVGGIRE